MRGRPFQSNKGKPEWNSKGFFSQDVPPQVFGKEHDTFVCLFACFLSLFFLGGGGGPEQAYLQGAQDIELVSYGD